jgi:hypothetical protein
LANHSSVRWQRVNKSTRIATPWLTFGALRILPEHLLQTGAAKPACNSGALTRDY